MREQINSPYTTLLVIITILISFTACNILGSGDDDSTLLDFPGTIVFSDFSDDDGWWHLFTINADGTELKQLTFANEKPTALQDNLKDRDFYAYYPTWNTDGETIIASGRSGLSVEAIISIDKNGENLSTINKTVDDDTIFILGHHPEMSPDGEKLLYNDPHGGAFIFSTTTDDTVLFHDKFNENGEQPWFPIMERPRWSPDGKRILFSSKLIDNQRDLYISNKDGTGLKRLETGFIDIAAWHPNNRHVTVHLEEDTPGVYLADIETNQRELVFSDEETGFQLIPQTWSPDGNYMLAMGIESVGDDNTYHLVIADRNDGSASVIHSSSHKYRNADWFIE